jgi:glycosyltransferase involved in cell wall biosynthesis
MRHHNSRIRVLFFIGDLAVGGTESQFVLLARALDRHRFEPLVWSWGEWGRMGEILRRSGIAVHRHDARIGSVEEVDRTVAWLRSLRAHVFYILASIPWWPDALLARLAGIPVVIQRRCAMCHWDESRSYMREERLRNFETDAVVMTSRATRKEWLSIETDWPAEKIRMIPNGVKVPREPSSGLGGLLIGNVANFRPLKGQEVLIEAFARVSRRFPEARLAIAGRDVDQLSGAAKRTGVKDRVKLAGEVADPGRIYRRMAVYAHPSHTEGLSNAILEAMSFGLPVVASRAGAMPDLVENGVNGYLVPPGDREALAGAIESLLGDESRRRRMGEAARARAIEDFSIASVAARHEQLFRECLDAAVSGDGKNDLSESVTG